MTGPRDDDALRLPATIVAQMRAGMAGVAEQTIAAIIGEVPSYRDPFQGRMGRTIETAVRVALDGFLDLAARSEGIDAGDQIEEVLEAAYALGRGEARSGRTMDALAQAYRIGARVSWREMSAAAVDSGLDAATVARLAELVFAFIDELSDASVSGHADELAVSGRMRQQRLDRLAIGILDGAPETELVEAAERADWEPPTHLTAAIVADSRVRSLRGMPSILSSSLRTFASTSTRIFCRRSELRMRSPVRSWSHLTHMPIATSSRSCSHSSRAST